MSSPAELLVDALANDHPLTEEMLTADPVTLAEMAIAGLREPPIETLAALHLPRTVEEWVAPWPPPPLKTPGVTPPVVFVLAHLRGDKAAGHLAKTVNIVSLAWFVWMCREQRPTSDPVARLELFQWAEWRRHEGQQWAAAP